MFKNSAIFPIYQASVEKKMNMKTFAHQKAG